MEPKEAGMELAEPHGKWDASEQARLEYIEVYSQMVSEMSPSHLEIFTKELMDSDKHFLQDKEQLVVEVKQKLLESLHGSLERFWQEFDINSKIPALIMLKEQFREYEGTNWEIHKKTPHERILPLRIRFKELRLQQLQKQLRFQNEELEEIQKENARNRAHIHAVQQERSYIKENMARYGEYLMRKKSEIIEMVTDVLDIQGESEK